MENNPVKLLFNLSEAGIDIVSTLASKGKLLASEEASYARMELCYSCDFLDKESVKCKRCGCFMKIKTRLESSKCPISKW